MKWRGGGLAMSITAAEGEPRMNECCLERDRLRFQLERANRIIGWMMPYIGTMCPPSTGLYDLNIHCCENRVPEPGDETKGASLRQHAAGARPSGVSLKE